MNKINQSVLPSDVLRLVVAARALALHDIVHLIRAVGNKELAALLDELDEAGAAFADRVPWNDERVARVLHGSIDIDGQQHAIKIEIHGTEGGTFDDDGHPISLAGIRLKGED